MKTSFVEGNDGLSERDIIFYAEDEGDKELLKRIYFSVVTEYLLMNFDEIKPYAKTDLDIALKKDGRDTEFKYAHMYSSNKDFEAASVVLSLAELITNAEEIKYRFKDKRNFFMSLWTEKGRVIFETYSKKRKNAAFARDINVKEDGEDCWPDNIMEYGFKVRRF